MVPDVTLDVVGVAGGAAAAAAPTGTSLLASLASFAATATSRFRADGGALEGVYVRIDDPATNRLVDRFKVVRDGFISGNEHWSRHAVTRNSCRVPSFS